MTDGSNLTPAGHRAKAEEALAALSRYNPGEPGYHGLALSAAVHILIAISDGLDTLAACLEPPPEPELPGLPAGWRLTTRQSEKGEHLWGYTLAVPGCPPELSPYRWGSSGSALFAGLRYADRVATGNQPELYDGPPQP